MIKSVHAVTYAQYLRNKINHLINSLEDVQYTTPSAYR